MTRFRNLLRKIRLMRANDEFIRAFEDALFAARTPAPVAARPEKRLLPAAGRHRVSHRRIEA